ncbi:copper chaperone [Bernardetia litoralis DSM 6794]|uniref:Copper chaperone n=1 Tax=Bernardetia litoralis (strain ATCC 23117 / DSM 6794 / NBRC 15988 / NCIMB 1366 / Fx l1 / Sio-4) TaxID=880071 RepID=I4APQ2_BERLS|nr:heavy metal-associated domain-containing protein [Bernardetia litoralis]AFM05937.1 copper chaperone [Bernardetia litoralis DSM 6794]
MKSIIFSLAFIFIAFVGTSNTFAPTKKATIVIKTESIQCGMCKERIEEALLQEKGVKYVTVDVDKKETTVTFNPKKIDADAIKKAISAVGYDADDIAAETTAYEKLPTCCQKGGH